VGTVKDVVNVNMEIIILAPEMVHTPKGIVLELWEDVLMQRVA
jgi:hypothetical protein